MKESSALGSKLGLFSASDAKMNELFPDLLMRRNSFLVSGMFRMPSVYTTSREYVQTDYIPNQSDIQAKTPFFVGSRSLPK